MKKQYFLTVSEGKRLIARVLSKDERILNAAKEHTLVILTGTTNGYVAEEVLKELDLPEVNRYSFFRGIYKGPMAKDLQGAEEEVIIRRGERIYGKTIYDIEPELKEGDVILKGANAVYLKDRQAGVVIGNSAYGTLSPISLAHFGRRVAVICPVGLEKRVEQPITELMKFVNAPDCSGTRFALSPGEPFTEIDALETTGVKVCLIASGGVAGFEGSVLLGAEGTEEAIKKADELIRSVKGEKIFGE